MVGRSAGRTDTLKPMFTDFARAYTMGIALVTLLLTAVSVILQGVQIRLGRAQLKWAMVAANVQQQERSA